MNGTEIIMTASNNISSSAGVDKNSWVGIMQNIFVGGDWISNLGYVYFLKL